MRPLLVSPDYTVLNFHQVDHFCILPPQVLITTAFFISLMLRPVLQLPSRPACKPLLHSTTNWEHYSWDPIRRSMPVYGITIISRLFTLLISRAMAATFSRLIFCWGRLLPTGARGA